MNFYEQFQIKLIISCHVFIGAWQRVFFYGELFLNHCPCCMSINPTRLAMNVIIYRRSLDEFREHRWEAQLFKYVLNQINAHERIFQFESVTLFFEGLLVFQDDVDFGVSRIFYA